MDGPARCPRCDVEMVAGQLRVKGSLPGFLFVGFSWQHLWWTDLDGNREIVLESGAGTIAGRCPSCGMVAFDPPRRR